MSRYGYCPICGASGCERERRINGNDKCENGHVYPSKERLNKPMNKFYVHPDVWFKTLLPYCDTDEKKLALLKVYQEAIENED